ncbi:MAG TPA: nuclear transport factor 2 family protein [Verrucomicrobiae bacterium]|nr:nuclear transport factor 2 family protein [Verrucomicrobiae bacterium]
MNRFIPKSLAAAVVGAMLIAGAALCARAQVSVQDEVLDLQKKFQAATVSGDTAAVASLMADDVIFIHGNAAAQSKTEFLAGIKNGQLAFSAYDLSDPKVVMFKGGAIVTGIVDISFRPRPNAPGAPRTLHMRGSSVWLHGSTGWKLILDQDTPIQGPPREVPLAPRLD